MANKEAKILARNVQANHPDSTNKKTDKNELTLLNMRVLGTQVKRVYTTSARENLLT